MPTKRRLWVLKDLILYIIQMNVDEKISTIKY
jgi:hypothetical protein